MLPVIIILEPLFIVLIILISSCLIDSEKVTIVDNECHYKEDMSPVTGKVILYWSGNKKSSEGYYKDGKADGNTKYWYVFFAIKRAVSVF